MFLFHLQHILIVCIATSLSTDNSMNLWTGDSDFHLGKGNI